jgi:hypothetical protein
MNASPIPTVNHHADHPGFAGVIGLLCGLFFLAKGRANARLAVDIASVGASDHVVDVGCAQALPSGQPPAAGHAAPASTRHRSCCGWHAR